jgi:ferredoxin
MLCVVKDTSSGRLLPACSAPAEGEMVIETESGEVREARKDILELLLREHAGDCRAPCDLGCPAHADIPAALRAVERGQTREALHIIRQSIPFPALICGVCPAPCESACRRGRFDAPVSIRLLFLHAADASREKQPSSSEPSRTPITEPLVGQNSTGKKVAVVGAGLAGLSAAYYLGLEGHACTVFSRGDLPAGAFRYGKPRGSSNAPTEKTLIRDIFGSDLSVLDDLGVALNLNTGASGDISIRELAGRFDSVIVATGEKCLLEGDAIPGVFTCAAAFRPAGAVEGDARAFPRITPRDALEAARDAAEGRAVALSVHRFLGDRGPDARKGEFNSRLGTLLDGELEEFLKDSAPYSRVSPSAGEGAGQGSRFDKNEAVREARRCLRCDCAKKSTCALRRYAARYGAGRNITKNPERKRFERIGGGSWADHPSLQFDSGKCIKCGICVRITENRGENPGLAFLGRGYGVRVGVPFGGSLSSALAKTAQECARACPTGALALVRYRTANPEAGDD